MTLQEYLEKYRLTPIQFARNIEARTQAITDILSKRRRPGIGIALAIHTATNGLVDYDELRGDEKWKSI